MEDSFVRAASAKNAVAVFFTTVPRLSDDQVASLLPSLIAEESQRASRFVFAKDRELYITAHALLRFCLSAAACEPQRKFKVGEYGKPELDPPFGESPLHFNLSHTNGLAACALSHGHAVGVDVEEINRQIDFDAVARSVFAPEEQQLLARSLPDERAETFFRLWVLKESFIKGIGRGLGLPLEDIAFRLDPLSLTVAASIGEHSVDWQMLELVPTSTHRLALAVKRIAQADLTVTSLEIPVFKLIEWSKDPAARSKQS